MSASSGEKINNVKEELHVNDGSAGGAKVDTDIAELCRRSLPKGGIALVKRAFPSGAPRVRERDSGEKAEDVIRDCYLALILSSKTIDVPPLALEIRKALREEDLTLAARQIYGGWIADGAPAKYRGALLMYGLHARDEDVLILRKQIDDWAEHARGAIAADAARRTTPQPRRRLWRIFQR